MANKTVRLFSGDLAGETGLTLELINPDTGAVGNGAGDSLTEVANGLFETTVTEAITGWWKAVVKKGAVTYASGGNLYIASDVVGEYLVDDFANNTAVANWAALTVDHTSTGSFGALLNTIGKVNLVIEGTVTNGVTPTTLTFSSNVDEFTDAFNNAILLFISGSLVGQSSPIVSYTNADGVFLLEKELTSAPVDGDKFIVIAGTHVHSVASIQNGLATLTSVTTLTGYVDTEVAAIKAVTDKMDGMLILDGSVYQFTTNAVENVAGTPVYVYPLAIGQEQRNTHQEITVYTSETGSQYFFAVDSNNTALDLTGLSLEFRVGDNKTKAILYTASTADATLTVTLTNKVTFTKSTKFTRFANSDVSYSLRNMSAGGEVLLDGPIRLKWAP